MASQKANKYLQKIKQLCPYLQDNLFICYLSSLSGQFYREDIYHHSAHRSPLWQAFPNVIFQTPPLPLRLARLTNSGQSYPVIAGNCDTIASQITQEAGLKRNDFPVSRISSVGNSASVAIRDRSLSILIGCLSRIVILIG